MDPYNSMSLFETLPPQATDPNALDQFSQPPAGNVVDWAPPAAPEGRSWSDKMKEALMLAATVRPIGKMMGSKLGRLALGAGACAGAGATALLSSDAQAADGGSGDPMLDALQGKLQFKQQPYNDEFHGTAGSRWKGEGPNTRRIQDEINDLLKQIESRHASQQVADRDAGPEARTGTC